MSKFYRVKQDTFLWLEGAILEFDSKQGANGGYTAISDLWDKVELNDEYITANIVEAKENKDVFERVYDTKILGKVKYLTKEAARKVHNDLYKGKN